MSFTDNIKKELVKQKISSKIEALIELTSVLKTSASISIRNAFFNIDFVTENQDVSKRVCKLIKKLYNYNPVVSYRKNESINQDGIYTITVEDEKIVNTILNEAAIDYYGNYIEENEIILSRLEDEKKHKKIAYLRGAFIGGGSMVDPKKKLSS